MFFMKNSGSYKQINKHEYLINVNNIGHLIYLSHFSLLGSIVVISGLSMLISGQASDQQEIKGQILCHKLTGLLDFMI